MEEFEMDFADELKNFASRLGKLKANICTEEATKTSIVLPFFQLLGYDIFNPLEFVPEYIADTGTKKGEKVDYAILQNGNPIMIVEVKPVNTDLNTKHINQLFRYFTVTKARFGILTNGIIYRFYSDLEEPNKMDLMPFLEINLLDLKNDAIVSLKKFRKECFNTKEILNNASELKYILLLKSTIAEQFSEPSEQFIRTLIRNIYNGVKTQAVIDKFRELILIAMNEYINDILNVRLQNAIMPISDESNSTNDADNIDFLDEEKQTLEYVKSMLPTENIVFRKTTRYAYMHLLGSQYKWICRVSIRQDNNLFVLHKFDTTDYETEYYFEEPSQLEQIKNYIIDTYTKCTNM